MPEPIERFEFMKSRVVSQVDTSLGKPLCFIDVITPEGFPDISIGWSPAWDKFGVYVDGEEVFPFPDDTIEIADNIATTDPTVPEEGL